MSLFNEKMLLASWHVLVNQIGKNFFPNGVYILVGRKQSINIVSEISIYSVSGFVTYGCVANYPKT